MRQDMWDELTAFSEVFTCYSSALAAWAAHEHEHWQELVNPGMTLTLVDGGESVFGFAHFPPGLRMELGLERVHVATEAEAVEGVLGELERSGRAIVAGDGWNLPWHVAHGKRHVPHWFVLGGSPDEPEVIDPFACRNELGAQQPARVPVARGQLPGLLAALPGGDPVLQWRERLALGDDCGPQPQGGCQWFVRADVHDFRAPAGQEGPQAVKRLAGFAREHAQDPRAYEQADDIWSIARHRAFLAQHAAARAGQTGDETLAEWACEHGQPLAGRWAHMAPLLMQARLVLAAGRPASESVANKLDELAGLELGAARSLPAELDPSTPSRRQAAQPTAGNRA